LLHANDGDGAGCDETSRFFIDIDGDALAGRTAYRTQFNRSASGQTGSRRSKQ